MNKEMKYELHSGIYKSLKKDGSIYYRISVTYHSKHISLGSSPDCSAAGLIYIEASNILHTDIGIDDYDSSKISVPFDKFVTLINFRDNNIYIRNPIILHKTFFSYYIDPDTELKFDMEDLFYYSGHKIMRRGNHIFTANYGLQESIGSRYGIKSFAVAGRDYLFINDDHYDYRYSNIKILNRYSGISCISGRAGSISKKVYAVRMHLNGDWKIGEYPDEKHAAIAYNKALDELKKRKLKPRTPYIYIEELSARDYASIYSSIKLPSKFMAYLSAYDIKHIS